MDGPVTAPVLSTPADVLLEPAQPVQISAVPALSVEQFDIQYEIQRTVKNIREHKWKRIALQFPDSMLADGPRVYERLNSGLAATRKPQKTQASAGLEQSLSVQPPNTHDGEEYAETERLIILGDTSYGACCVDEIAAEHASADGVVHYGRSCLSPTQRLPVIYVFTTKQLDHKAALDAIISSIPDKTAKICLLTDVPWQHHIDSLSRNLRDAGYEHILAPEITHDPSSPIPNRLLPSSLRDNEDELKQYAVFHVAAPPTSLVLTLTSRVKQLYIYDPASGTATAALETSAPAVLRRRYASLLRLSSTAVIGILINTLSVKNYMTALEHVQSLIAASGKKAYTFVVGKLNPAKLANFAEVGGWVVIGCWESSLIDSKEFLAPVITPFELEIALMSDDSRVWGQEWISDFQTLLQRKQVAATGASTNVEDISAALDTNADWQDQSEDDEPPEFDLRTGRYVSRPKPSRKHNNAQSISGGHQLADTAPASSALVQRAKGDVATINGVLSPGADFLRSKREWQGLGSDFAIEYDRDDQGNIQGASMEEGRSGVAKGYKHSEIATNVAQ